MKPLFGILFFLLFVGCNQSGRSVENMQAKVDSLEKKLAETYKPGFGEFMSNIQVHHAKLWFAGENQNWDLADFEIHEMEEGLENVEKFCADREEASSIGMINTPLDSVSLAIKEKSLPRFKASYILLTNTCNNCHKLTKHEFNKVIIPTTPPVSNQSFQALQ